MLTARENFMNFYKNKPMDRFPDLFTDANFLMSITGMGDRPPNNRGGKDWYGCSWVYEADGMDSCVPDLSIPPLFEEIEEWHEKMIFPDPDAVDWEACAKADGVEDFDPDKINYLTLMEGPFERLHTIMGFENAMVAMATNPDEVNALLERLTDIKMQNIRVLADYYKVDVINYHDDWGTQNNLFFAPEMWRELIRPHIKRAVDYTHELGLVFELHCCGKIEKLIPEIADLGVDCLQCMGINDIVAAKAITGDRLAYMVSLRYQEFETREKTGTLTESMVRESVRNEILAEAPGGRYMPFMLPVMSEWLPIANDEICRVSDELFIKN